MPANYANPPMVEALCSFQFEPGQAWDWTIPGLVYSQVKEMFPVKREQQIAHFGGIPGAASSTQNVSRIQFISQDERSLVQVGTDFFGVNVLPPYPNWMNFRESIQTNLDIYTNIARPQSVKQINLRFINKIEIPSAVSTESLSLDRYLKVLPGIPMELHHHKINNFIQRVELSVENATGVLVLQSGSLNSENDEYASFLLDLDFVSTFTDALPVSEVGKWVDRAHDEIELAFEASITDASRLLFKGK